MNGAAAMPPVDLRLLKTILSTQSATYHTRAMRRVIRRQLDAIDATYRTDHGNIYATKGNAAAYPTFVAHTDTVHAILPNGAYRVYQEGPTFYAWNEHAWTPAGIGGDDKCGVFIALECLRILPAAKAVFFRDEEHGCIGAQLADMRFFDDSSFVLEADRKGASDFVSNAAGEELHGPEFAAAVAPLLTRRHFTPEPFGGLTDVVTLKERGLKVAAANASAGYYEPHRATEFIDVPDLINTRDLFLEIAAELGAERQPHNPVPPPPPIRFSYGTYRALSSPSGSGWRPAWKERGRLPIASEDRHPADAAPIVVRAYFDEYDPCPGCGRPNCLEYQRRGVYYCWECACSYTAEEEEPPGVAAYRPESFAEWKARIDRERAEPGGREQEAPTP